MNGQRSHKGMLSAFSGQQLAVTPTLTHPSTAASTPPLRTNLGASGAAGPNPAVVAMIFERFVQWKLEQEEQRLAISDQQVEHEVMA